MIDSLKGNISILPLKIDDVSPLCNAFKAAPDDYSRYFTPFQFTPRVLETILSTATKDRYNLIRVDERVAGFYMLRGFDEGFQIPTYGVWISPDFGRLGIGRLTLDHAISTCRLMGVKELMLKVHPENSVAKNLYEKSGFKRIGFDKKNGNFIYSRIL